MGQRFVDEEKARTSSITLKAKNPNTTVLLHGPRSVHVKEKTLRHVISATTL